jgi:hypothetical protein
MHKLKLIWALLEGKKTHLVAIALVALNIAAGLNLISPAELDKINIVLVALGLSAIRSGIHRL